MVFYLFFFVFQDRMQGKITVINTMTNTPNSAAQDSEKNIEKNEWTRSTLDSLLAAALKKRFHQENKLNITSVNNINYSKLP